MLVTNRVYTEAALKYYSDVGSDGTQNYPPVVALCQPGYMANMLIPQDTYQDVFDELYCLTHPFNLEYTKDMNLHPYTEVIDGKFYCSNEPSNIHNISDICEVESLHAAWKLAMSKNVVPLFFTESEISCTLKDIYTIITPHRLLNNNLMSKTLNMILLNKRISYDFYYDTEKNACYSLEDGVPVLWKKF